MMEKNELNHEKDGTGSPALTESAEPRILLGSLLAEIGREAQMTEEEFAVFETIRRENTPSPISSLFADEE